MTKSPSSMDRKSGRDGDSVEGSGTAMLMRELNFEKEEDLLVRALTVKPEQDTEIRGIIRRV